VFPGLYEISKYLTIGSDEKIASKIGVVETDLLFYFEKVTKQFAFADLFYSRLKETLKKQKIDFDGYKCSYTGHSLGAILAEVMAWQNNKSKAVTFESPGTKKFIENLEKGNVFNFKGFKITSYLSAPNVVNTAKPHVGTLIRIFPNSQHPSTIIKNKPNGILSWFSHYSQQTTAQHNLDSILETFDEKTGADSQMKCN
jgi:hypothetical protein